MKKIISVALALVLALCLLGCDAVTIGPFSSKYLDTKDYEAAVQELQLRFKEEYKGCTLKEIRYAGDAAVKAEADTRGLGTYQVIVLEADFTTDGTVNVSGLSPNQTYEGYRFVLTGDSAVDLWEVVSRG